MSDSYIKRIIELCLDKGEKNIIIFPFGEAGIRVKEILNKSYGIKEKYIIDNHLCKYNPDIKPLSFFEDKEDIKKSCVVILSSTSKRSYEAIKENVKKIFPANRIYELGIIENKDRRTKVGKYSYGPLCDHYLVESVGAFCSFAEGTDVVENHITKYLTTSPIIAKMNMDVIGGKKYQENLSAEWFMDGLEPKAEIEGHRRINIGNDVWLGKNVIITNGSDIGNGVIAGAGAVITKPVPDYAVVVGVPARIIRYRYTPEQIYRLNELGWWNWDDNLIKRRFDDFYLPIDVFLEKYKN